MTDNFAHATLGGLDRQVYRLGLSGTYRPGKDVIHKALDAGVNYLFCYGFDGQIISTVREMTPSKREKLIVATGAYNLLVTRQDFRKTLEKRLQQLRTDYIDVFLYLGVTQPKHFPEAVREELRRLKEDGKVRAVAMSCHNRKFAAELGEKGDLDVLMIRYNAAHRGAEQDIFPHVPSDRPGIVSYTATRWSYLLRRPRGWPKDGAVPTAGMCYRFVLSNPRVEVCMTAPSNLRQMEENLAAVRHGPLSEDELRFMREFGDAVYRSNKWFM